MRSSEGNTRLRSRLVSRGKVSVEQKNASVGTFPGTGSPWDGEDMMALMHIVRRKTARADPLMTPDEEVTRMLHFI